MSSSNSNQAEQRRAFKRARLADSRKIRNQNLDPALKDGYLDVASFIAARDYEIQQLQQTQLNSQAAAKKRTFQKVPRSLRRRTASHNVKRVPKRLRQRAIREMKLDNLPNTPAKKKHLRGRALYRQKTINKLLRAAAKYQQKTPNVPLTAPPENTANELSQGDNSTLAVENTISSYDHTAIGELAPPPIGKAKYAARQKTNTWLPTHVWHAKRAHMVKKWGYSVPAHPTQKAYRPTHRASVQSGAVLCDSTYHGTIIIEADEVGSIMECLNVLTRGNCKGGSIQSGRRSWEGWIYDPSSSELKPVVEALIYIEPKPQDQQERKTSRAMIRLHPAMYTEIFGMVQTAIASINSSAVAAVSTRNISVHDCRYSIASFDITGPKALTALTMALRPYREFQGEFKQSAWASLSGINSAASLPANSVINLSVTDPRFSFPPKKSTSSLKEDQLIDFLLKWDENFYENLAKSTAKRNTLFSIAGRHNSYRNQLSLKQLHKRRQEVEPGKHIETKFTDPDIPVIVFRRNRDYFTVCFPWFWSLPLWYSLVHIPDVHLGGLDQKHQLAFEKNLLYYPDDYPFLEPGYVSQYEKSMELRAFWERKPSGRRLEYSKLDLTGGPKKSKQNSRSLLKAVHSVQHVQEEGESGNTSLDDYCPLGEIGNAFGCDWRFLQLLEYFTAKLELQKQLITSQDDLNAGNLETWKGFKKDLKSLKDVYDQILSEMTMDEEWQKENNKLIGIPLRYDMTTDFGLKKGANLKNGNSVSSAPLTEYLTANMHQLDTISLSNTQILLANIASDGPERIPLLQVIPVSLSVIGKGHIENSARIYMLPKGTSRNDITTGTPVNWNYLIGFVTTGSFNLSKGNSTAVGYISSNKERYASLSQEGNICVVRNVGTSVFRLAQWKRIGC